MSLIKTIAFFRHSWYTIFDMSEQTNILDAIRSVVHEEIRPFKDEIKRDITDFKDEILSGIDGVHTKLDAIAIEQKSMSYTMDQHRDKLNNHENRIQKVEAQAGLA